MDSHELLMTMERALESRRALKEFFRSKNLERTQSHEAALLEKVEETRTDFEIILSKYVDERIEVALSKSRE
jgi:hypothetical protein